ncbi:DUF1934 domain-containing protein [Alicyclobacillus dauci]|uniref:DUF1934 domain-containing protein n=1 Tax=Alicyclobacillus dauci TaxID=1475485 RepID=A0ABY6Z2R2_9BACL|nr:DUF1934 domain-containing protein [Alicyclobacillus dauci]WAH36898.1 DUF1934 domain-containing protein [Alicyclobacillus dauci]
MFWLSDNEHNRQAQTCGLSWERYTEGSGDAEVERIPAAVWRQRGRAHYVSYEEPVSDKTGDVRTTLKIEADALTWIRHGLVTWTHTFRAGEEHTSRMLVGGQAMEITTSTKRLEIDVTGHGGRVFMEYDMIMGGDPQRIRLTLRFEQGECHEAHE